MQGGGSGNKASKYRIDMNPDGTISIPDKSSSLYVSADNLEQSVYFRDNARPGGDIF